jgi:hypothetical protein
LLFLVDAISRLACGETDHRRRRSREARWAACCDHFCISTLFATSARSISAQRACDRAENSRGTTTSATREEDVMLRETSVAVAESWACANSSTQKSEQLQCEQLHRRLKRIVKARGALDAQEAAALRDAEALRVWRHYGYASLLEYMEMEMGYSPRAAIERLRVAKAIQELPVIADAMEQGDLSFSAAREITRVATPETEEAWLDAANDKNLRQVEELVSGHKQGDKPSDPVDPKLRKRTLRYEDIDPETVALIREAKLILERKCGERLADDAFLRSLARLVIDGGTAAERTRAPYQIGVTVCERCGSGSQHSGGISVEMSPPALEAALCDAEHIGHIDRDEVKDRHVEHPDAGARPAAPARPPATTAPRARRGRRGIPQALRRKVKARDGAKCAVPWCRSARNCDLHHLTPISQGGQHALDNLLTLCESHHLAHHAGALAIEGPASAAKFTRRVQSSLALVEREVDTRKALLALGFDKHEVKAAVERTRTHVGTAELTIEQWIKIALGYCPRPRA